MAVQKAVWWVQNVVCSFVLASFLCWNGAARAADWRLLDPLTDGSTSQCIGDPKTPLCAAETYTACMFSGRKELCSAVGVDYETEFALLRFAGPVSRLYFLFYKPMGQFTLTRKDIPARYPKFGGRSWQPGDVALRFAWQTCKPNIWCLEEADDPNNMIAPISCRTLDTCTEFPAFEVFQVVRNVGDHWTLIADFRKAELHQMLDQRK